MTPNFQQCVNYFELNKKRCCEKNYTPLRFSVEDSSARLGVSISNKNSKQYLKLSLKLITSKKPSSKPGPLVILVFCFIVLVCIICAFAKSGNLSDPSVETSSSRQPEHTVLSRSPSIQIQNIESASTVPETPFHPPESSGNIQTRSGHFAENTPDLPPNYDQAIAEPLNYPPSYELVQNHLRLK